MNITAGKREFLKKEKKMAELKLVAAALVLFGMLYFVWRD